ncbi:MAG: GNAT family N-acetyltransferase [Rhizobiales bacterium]|nr:GNAT family N-acetyltransferase [Hyphomicrobiales bacterium]
MIVLETPRLMMRRLEPNDLDSLAALYADPEVRRYFPEGVLTRGETAEEIDWFRNGHPDDPRLGLWATIERASGEFIGRCGLLLWEIEGRREIEIAYLIARTHWRTGLGAEAAHALVTHGFETLGLNRLIALVHPDNIPSAKTAKRAGLYLERPLTLDGMLCHVYAIERQVS